MNNINLFVISNNPNSYITFKYCFEKNKDINFVDCSYNKVNNIKVINPKKYNVLHCNDFIDDPQVIKNIVHYNKKVKVIVILENPLKRITDYAIENKEHLVNSINEIFLNECHYIKHIKNMLNEISMKKIYILIHETFINNYEENSKHICDFLEIEHSFNNLVVHKNSLKFKDYVINKIIQHFKDQNNELENGLNSLKKFGLVTFQDNVVLPWNTTRHSHDKMNMMYSYVNREYT